MISVVVPSYNEKDNVAEMIQRVEKALGEQLLEIIIVDDNSPDETWKIVEELHDPKVRLIRRMNEKGLASAYLDGLKEVRGEVVAWLDCDLGLPPEDLPRLVGKLGEYDVVIGSRYVEGGKDLRPWNRKLASIALNTMGKVFLSSTVTDYTSGFVAVKREVLNKVSWDRAGFGEYFIEFAYKAIKAGYKVGEVGYEFKDRVRGDSKSTESVGRFFKLGWQYGTKILKLRFAQGHQNGVVEKGWTKQAYTTRTTCRMCDAAQLTTLFSLGEQYVNNFVTKEEMAKQVKAPLEMVFCENCTLVQLKHTAPQELLYSRFYWDKSGGTETMRKALRDVTAKAEKMFGLKEGEVVLDIGSNDGTMLRTYQVPGLITVGVEPADNLMEEGRVGLTHHIHDFWIFDKYWSVVGKKAKVITAIGMFYDMENPNSFIADAEKALTDDGVFIAQLMCLKNMLDSNDVGNVCHEHLEFYSFASLEYLFNKNGLEIFDIEINEVNGGSYRVYAKKKGAKVKAARGAATRVLNVRKSEKGLQDKKVYQKFFERLEKNKQKCVEFITRAKAKGKKVWVYGASTKGNVILQYYGLDGSLIEGASERSPWKWGKYTVGSMIPCVKEEEARLAQPDYFLVLPYAFFDEFYAREKEWRAQGGKFIVPLPKFRVVK